METLFFIIVIVLIIGLLIFSQNKKEYMGSDPIEDLKLENEFRSDQIDYYGKKNQDIHTNCEESNFIKLKNNKKGFKKIDVCEFFTGRKVKENFNSSDVVPMEASPYTEQIETCKYLNQSLQKNIDSNTSLDDVIQKIQQIPEFIQIKSDGGLEDDKGCGYCYNKDTGVGEILYGDSLGPYKNVKSGNVCENWIKPGDISRGGGVDIKNNMWRSQDDPEKMEFGGNQGVINDSVKIHEQQICSRVQNCGDLDGEKSICGWCYMGRKGDGKGEGMVAMVDPSDPTKRIGETKYMDDYCPWPGEVSRSGKPTKNWTGPTEGSAWLKEQSNQDYTAEDIQKIDLQLQKDKINKLTAKKNNDALTPKERTAAGDMIKYVKQKMKFIMNFGLQATDQNETYKDWKEKAIPSQGIGEGSNENNKFLYKCGTGDPILEGNNKNIFFLHSYNGLSEEQKVILKGLHETHEFFKKCHSNMSILGEKITLKDNEELITKCHQLTNILNKKGNEELKKLFLALDLSKDESGCLENCEFKDGQITFDSTKKRNWWNTPTDREHKCKALSLPQILELTGSAEEDGGVQKFAELQAEIEEGPTVENSTCCNDEWDPTEQKFKRCSQQEKKSLENCKGGCSADNDVNQSICKKYADDLGLDVNDINQYDPNGYVSKGYPYGCSTDYEGSHVVYVPKRTGGDEKGGEDTYPQDGQNSRAKLKTNNKKAADDKDRDYGLAAQKISDAEAEEDKIPSEDRNIQNYNRNIRYWQEQIDRQQSTINYHKKHGKNWKRGTKSTSYRQRYWHRCAYRIIWCIGAYRYRWRTKRTSYWYVSGLTSSANAAIRVAERNISHYTVAKETWKTKKTGAENKRKGFRDEATKLRNDAQKLKTDADTKLARAKGPSYPFSNPDQQGEGRTIRYSVCGLINKDGIDYPTQTAKMFRHDPDTRLRENKEDWAKIINKENKITSFEELLKVWLKSKINVNRGGDEGTGGEYSKTVKDIWDIFIEMVKEKNPGLLTKDPAIAKNRVLGNSPLNNNIKIGKLIDSGREIGVLGAEEIEGLPKADGSRQSQPGWRHTVIKDIDTGSILKDKGERLMTSNAECKALNAKFPCFKNWQGNKDVNNKVPSDKGYDPAKPLGHSNECYDELWHTQTLKNFDTGKYQGKSCYTLSKKDFKTQMAKPFDKYPNKIGKDTLIPYTINVMNKQPITSVKQDIERIRKVADTSDQYLPIYSLDDISNQKTEHSIFEDDDGKKIQIDEEARQINRSAKLATLACYGEEPPFDDGNNNTDVPFSCKDRFRKKDKNFPRPKECLDYYWEKHTKGISNFAGESYTTENPFKDTSSWNRGNNYHILHTGYNTYPPNNESYGKVWGNKNMQKDEFEDQIHYNYNNTQLNNELKKYVNYIKNFDSQNANANDYDTYLYYKRMVYETINEHEDVIWEYLKAEDNTIKVGNDGELKASNSGKDWVKMCWGDFKDALLETFGKSDFPIKEDGDGTLNLKNSPELINIIKDDGRATSDFAKNMSLFRKVIKTKDRFKFNPKFGRINMGGAIKFEVDFPTSITEKMYNKTWFPFWRFFKLLPNQGIKYYRRTEFNANERAQDAETKRRHTDFGKLSNNELWRRGFRLKDKGGSGCTSGNKCGVCEGDCDNDNDCKSGLKCFQRSSSSKQVPGCAKGGDGDIGTHDYCYKPQPVYNRLKNKGASGCTSGNKCGVCEGDCDNDNDCKSGLKCFQRSSSSTKVPGCDKGGPGDIGTHDYCYKP